MLLQTGIFLLVGVLLLILIALNAVLFWYARKANKKIDEILEKGKIKSFKDIFLAQKDKNDRLEEKIREAVGRIGDLEKISQITIQKVGTVRFNPFNDVGGNQSFVVALLDKKDNGFIISSLFVNEGSRVYAKSVRGGKSEYALSKEEEEALNRAITPK